jgi:hypothetical protein
MQLSNAISDALVAVTSIAVFFHFFSRVPFNNKIVWGLFFSIIATAAVAGTCRFLGMTDVIPLHQTLTTLGGTVGVAALMAGIWTLVNQQTASRTVLIGVVVVGLALFVLFLDTRFKPFEQVVQSLGMLVGMCIAVWGLMKKYQKSIWIVAGIMVIALGTQVLNRFLPFNPTDIYHYSLMAMMYCFGRAV